MRRSIWIMLFATLAVLAAAIGFQALDRGAGAPRYHQHLAQPSEEDLGLCEVCGGESALCTHLPIVTIQTGGQTIPGRPITNDAGVRTSYETTEQGDTEIIVSFSTIDEEGVWHHPEDQASIQGTARMRIRGNSSRWFDKASYRLKLTQGQTNPAPDRLPLLGMPAGETWALYGPFLDKTLIRNYMWMNLAGEIMPGWVPNVRFCELVLDGDYQGLYVLMEMIDVQDGRLELTEYDDGDAVTSYLLRIEPEISPERAMENFSFYTYRMEPGRQAELLYPGKTHQTEAVQSFVNADFSAVERMLYAGDMDDWAEELDLDAFVNYYILEEYLGLNDTFAASTYFYRDARGKLAIGPVWDFNNVLDNFFTPLPEEGFMLSQRGWFGELMRSQAFVSRVISRYQALRRGVLSDDNLLDYIAQTQAWLGSAVDRNFAVWGYSFDPEQLTYRTRRSPEVLSGQDLDDVNPESFQEATQWMVDYMLERGQWMDQHIDSLRQYCHPSKYASQSYE